MDWLMRHLYRMSLHSERTGMTSKNLAIVWSPNILRCDVSELDTQDALQVYKNQTFKPKTQSVISKDGSLNNYVSSVSSFGSERRLLLLFIRIFTCNIFQDVSLQAVITEFLIRSASLVFAPSVPAPVLRNRSYLMS